MKLAMVMVMLVASACAVPEEPPTIEPIAGPDLLPGHENQGTALLGALDDFPRKDGDRYWVSGNATREGMGSVHVVAANGVLHATEGSVTYSGADMGLIGLRFTSPVDGSEIQIAMVYPEVPDVDPIRYDLIWRPSPLVVNWTKPCGSEQANVISGHLTSDTRDHRWVEGDLSFSCMSGVAYKCHRWGYPDPGNQTSNLAPLFDACLKAGSAMYCHDDTSYTRDGTTINFTDRYGVRAAFRTNWNPWMLNTWPPPTDDYLVEAAWRANDKPLCLSRARWQSLKPDPCGVGNGLDDPRFHASGQYCEDIGMDAIVKDPSIQIINISLVNDMVLQNYATPSGDQLSTVMGYHDRTMDILPYPGMSYVGRSGVLLRVYTTEMDPNDFWDVYQYCTTSNPSMPPHRCVVTTASTAPATHPYQMSTTPEGHISKYAGPGRVALVLYYNPATGDYVTRTTRPSAAYTAVSTVGYVLP